MAFELLTCLREEVTCPICLDLLTEPLSLDCGHSFCQACITAKTKESVTSQGGESTCPVCRISYCTGELRPNWHVANIVERLRKVKVSPKEGQKINLCERHEEKLLLFCKTDRKVICWLCERSQEHRGHHTVLVEEVAHEFQEKLQAALWKLKNDQQEARMLEAVIGEERTSWKKQMQTERQSIQAQFKKLKDILECEELRELQNLESEEKAVLGRLAEAEDELAQQSQLATDLILDLECRLQGSTMDMLQDVNHLVERSEALSLKKPKTFLKEQRKAFRAPNLKRIIQAFEKETENPFLLSSCETCEDGALFSLFIKAQALGDSQQRIICRLKERILKEFSEMKGILDSEEKKVLQKLEEDKVNVLDNLVVARDQLDRQR